MAADGAVLLLADQLELYLAVFYPHMPPAAREAIIQRYTRSPISGRLPEVAGIVTSNHARHVFTNYELLLDEFSRQGIEQHRKKARSSVADNLNVLIKRWCRGAPVSHPELAAIRRRYKRIRKQQSALQLRLDSIIADENADLASFCRRWLFGHFETIGEADAKPRS